MKNRGFLEQILGKNILDEEPVSGDNDLGQSIRDHLALLLNTRQGSVPHLPEYGLPDLSEVYNSFPASIEYLRRSIKATIERYEPRLRRVRVELKESDSMVFEATFVITGEYQEDEEILGVQFLTTISNTGRAKVTV